MNVAREFLECPVNYFGDRPAIIFEGESITYRELHSRVDRLAGGLAARGVRLRERVCLFLPNIPEFVVSYYAVHKLGASVVALNSTLKHDEVLYALNDSQATCLITSRELMEHVPPRRETVVSSRNWPMGALRYLGALVDGRTAALAVIPCQMRPSGCGAENPW